MTKRRSPTKDELNLWRRATADVDRQIQDPPPPAKLKLQQNDLSSRPRDLPQAIANQNTVPARSTAMPALDPSRPVNTDRRTFERLKRGKIAIDRRLDLHGRTQIEAHEALDRFLVASAARGLRCVLIVTGKGVDGNGVLRQMMPRWLAEETNRGKIITYCTAQPHHGGAGALYVLLKRRRA